MREGVPEDMQVRDVFSQFMATLTGRDIAKSSNHHLTGFQAFVGPERRVSKLRPIDLDRYIARHPGWAESTRRTFANRVIAAINWAVKKGLIPRNPITGTPGFKRPGRFERRRGLIAEADQQKALAAAKPAFRAFLVALRESGARPSELRRARIEKCNLTGGYVLVPNKTDEQTGEAERVVYLSQAAKEAMIPCIGSRAEGLIFLTGSGKPWTHHNLEQHWHRLRKRLGIRGSLYQFRHGFASKAINESNVNPALVARLLGHSDLTMLLKHYLQEDPEALKRAIEQISGGEEGRSPPPAGTP